MNEQIYPFNEMLHLCKKINQEIYVENVDSLSQHQIDGIRFIYKQLVNKNPGVILNDLPGFGKCLLTVYFLKAVVQDLLNKPILIIASEDNELLKWNELFQKSGIDVESINPNAKKQVFAISINNISIFKTKEWSVVVVHDNQASKVIINSNFKCEFKIWITSVDLKENLKTLETIYMWITKEKFEMKQFIPVNDPYDIIKKSMLLDIFLEDIYFRSSCQNISVVEEAKLQNQVTRGKKDVTGSKIKKSKRRLDDDDLPDVSYETITNNKEKINACKENNNHQEKIKTNKEKTNNQENINTSKEVNTTVFSEYTEDNAQNNPPEQIIAIEQSNVKCNQSADSENGLIMDSQSVSFGHAIQDIIDHEKDITENNEYVNNFTEHVTNNALIENKEMESPIKINDTNNSFKHDNENTIESTTQDIHLKLEPDLSNNMDISENIVSADKSSQSIDSKLQELEEMALRKFKGSFLDSIF